MSKRDASHFITEYYTERGKVELMIPTDATDDDFALLKDMLALIEAKLKRRADRKTEPQKICKYCNGKCSWWVDGDCRNDDCRFKPKTEPQTERSE